jgi:hypothetical protein
MGLAIASLARSESVMERRRKVRDLTLRAGGHSSMDKVVSLWAGHDPAKPPDGPFSLAGGRPMKPTDRLPWISSTEIPDGPKGRHPFKSALRLLSYMIPWKDQASCSATHHRAMQLAIVERLLAVEKSIDEAL